MAGSKVNADIVMLLLAKFFSIGVVPISMSTSNVGEYLFPHNVAMTVCCYFSFLPVLREKNAISV